MGDVWTELCAYGTAVIAVPISDGAKQTAAELGYGGFGQTAPQQPAVQPMAQQAPPQYAQPVPPQGQPVPPQQPPAQYPGY
jgi:hypothetical protein